jgi:uracil-DNA glycosylase
MTFTREDVLRELELLPVWRPRAEIAEPQTLAPATQATAPFIETLPMVEVSSVLQPTYQVAMSADQTWGFVWLAEPALSQDAKLLFNNICLALNITKTSQSLLDDRATFLPKTCVIFGEATAQSWLKTSDNLVNLRGKLHLANHLQIVVTHHPHDLLITPVLKREAWQDLCLARSVLMPKPAV